ncbi:MAG: arsenate reductase ArsC [Pseudomonadota bacterium]
MSDGPRQVLVVCTGNSCRSIMGEALINALGAGRFHARSAGSRPAGYVHPKALATLELHGIAVDSPRSQSWDDYAGDTFDFVITVCDSAAGEPCPAFGGAARKLHWSTPDPAAVSGGDAEIDAAFEAAFAGLRQRVQRFVDAA